MTKPTIYLTSLFLTLAAGSATAQVAPPPPKAPPPTRAYTPPPPPPPRPEPTINRSNLVDPARQAVSSYDLDGLINFDENDRLIRLPFGISPEIAALKHNELIKVDDEELWEKIDTLFIQRQATIDRVVIDNLDLVLKLDGGILDNMNLQDDLFMIQGMITALTEGIIDPIKTLQDADALNAVQSVLTRRIATKYNNAFNTEMAADAEAQAAQDTAAGADPDDERIRAATIAARTMFGQMLAEPQASLDRQTLAAGLKLEQILSTLDLSDEEQVKIKAALRQYDRAENDKDRTDAVKEVLGKLSFEHAQDVLTKALETE